MLARTGLERTFYTGLFAANNDRLQELIILSFLVSLFDSLKRITALLSLANTHGVQSDLNPLPSLITVHGVVSPNNCSNFSSTNLLDLVQEFLHVSCSRFWIGVTSIAKEVDIYMGNLHVFGNFKESVEMILLGVL